MIERFRLFVGQGVRHDIHGYGVIRSIGDRSDTFVGVKFPASDERVEIDTLDYAVMPEAELETLQKKCETHGLETRNTRTLVLIADARDTGRMEAAPLPRQNVSVPPSGLTPIVTPGDKCFHGVYIPYLSDHPDMAQACSLCYPYKIAVKQGADYLA